MNTPLPGIITMTATMPFEILLLTLTIVKVYKNTTPSDSNPSSPIVRVAFYLNLSPKLISVSRCDYCCVMEFCRWDNVYYVLNSYMAVSQVVFGYCKWAISPRVCASNYCLQVAVRMTLVTIWLTLPPFLMTVAGDAEWGLESA